MHTRLQVLHVNGNGNHFATSSINQSDNIECVQAGRVKEMLEHTLGLDIV